MHIKLLIATEYALTLAKYNTLVNSKSNVLNYLCITA